MEVMLGLCYHFVSVQPWIRQRPIFQITHYPRARGGHFMKQNCCLIIISSLNGIIETGNVLFLMTLLVVYCVVKLRRLHCPSV
jgi:hypothetical protein